MLRLLEIDTLQSNLQFICQFGNESLLASLSLFSYSSIKHCEDVVFHDCESIEN